MRLDEDMTIRIEDVLGDIGPDTEIRITPFGRLLLERLAAESEASGTELTLVPDPRPEAEEAAPRPRITRGRRRAVAHSGREH